MLVFISDGLLHHCLGYVADKDRPQNDLIIIIILIIIKRQFIRCSNMLTHYKGAIQCSLLIHTLRNSISEYMLSASDVRPTHSLGALKMQE